MLSGSKIIAGLFVLIIYYFLTFHLVTEYLLDTTAEHPPTLTVDPFGFLGSDMINQNLQDLRWTSYNNYAAIPFFYSLYQNICLHLHAINNKI